MSDVILTPAYLIRELDALYAAHPAIDRLDNSQVSIVVLAISRVLAGLASVEFDDPVDETVVSDVIEDSDAIT